MPQIQELIEKAKAYLPNIREERVLRAYAFAEKAHSGQTRFSGESYIIHPLSVAEILLDFHPDEDTIIAALLHDVAEDTDRTLEDIEKAFGVEVKNLCWGLMKLSKVRQKELNDPQVENLRKLFLAMARDFRVVLLKLCDRLHNMRTLSHVRPEKKTRIAQETLNIYAPIAARLGIYRLKSQLEDLCFFYLYPQDYKNIENQLVKTEKWRESYIEAAKVILLEALSREGLQAKVDGRVKSIYSIYRKLQKKNKTSLDDIFDVFAMRVILPDIYKYGKEYSGHLYTALGIVHNNFTPLANRFKDYIAVPKVNGYRSLHTTVIGLGPKVHTQPTEIQLRTNSMHEGAEFGIAAHWLYEEENYEYTLPPTAKNFEKAMVSHFEPFVQKQKDWITGLGQIEKETPSNQELLENLKADIFQDRIFVLTPRGDVKDLPTHATPIDFAYAVHTAIGDHCVGAKVNGVSVTLDYELKSGEVVEIVTRKNSRPSAHWISFAKTNHAKNRIRNFFHDLDGDFHLREGKRLLNAKLEQLGRPILDPHLALLRRYEGKNIPLKEREEILKEIGKGAILAGAVIRKVFTMEELLMNRPHVPDKPGKAVSIKAEKDAHVPKLLIGGEPQMPYQFVQCCQAGFNDSLVGFVTRGRGVSVHRKNCLVIRNTESHRLVKVRALNGEKTAFPYKVKVQILADDRVGLVRDATHIIAERDVNIIAITDKVAMERGGRYAQIDLTLEIENFDQLEEVLSRLEKIPSVRRASKVN